MDHNLIEYPPVKFNLYREHESVSALNEPEVEAARAGLDVHVSGWQVPRPVVSVEHLGFPRQLQEAIRKAGFTQLTAIQSQALPAALSGRDVLGLAQTGSGKTMAFVWPLIVHILDQPMMQTGDGPIGLVLAPTRELCVQIFSESRRFAKVFNIRVCAVFGGAAKYEMKKALLEYPELLIATPGRLIDMIEMKATNLQRVTLLVIDEADRLLEMGFEVQVRSIMRNVRPIRQTLMFSATMKKRIEVGVRRHVFHDYMPLEFC